MLIIFYDNIGKKTLIRERGLRDEGKNSGNFIISLYHFPNFYCAVDIVPI
jgi:hypothetical protein